MIFPRGTILGRRVGDQPKDAAEHFMRCPACGGWIDCRDLGQVFEHEGPLPHPAADQPQESPPTRRAGSLAYTAPAIPQLERCAANAPAPIRRTNHLAHRPHQSAMRSSALATLSI